MLMNIFHDKTFSFVFNIKEKKTVIKAIKKYILYCVLKSSRRLYFILNKIIIIFNEFTW